VLYQAGPGTRVVINMSVGIHGGPHDGSSLIGLALQEVLERLRHDIAITVAAGNSAQERWSSTGQLAPGQEAERVLRVMPFDRTDSFLELWWAATPVPEAQAEISAGELQLQVLPPTGLPGSGWLAAGQAFQHTTPSGAPVYALSHLRYSALGDGPMALLSMAPTHGERGTALPGRWTIRLRNAGQTVLAFDAWVQRDEPPYRTDDPIQPSFDDFAEQRVGEGCALNDLACGALVLAVGAARLVDGQESPYSGRTRDGTLSARPKVRFDADLLAVADESRQAIGLFAAAVRSGEVFRMGGTSVAAPVVARKIANAWMDPADPMALRAGASLSAAAIKQAVIAWAGGLAPGAPARAAQGAPADRSARLPLVRP
jgi:hypothetical protein